MLCVTFGAIYSRFLSKVQAYDLLELATPDCYEQMNEWLESVNSDPRVRKLFANITINNTGQSISFLMKDPVDNDYDMNFVIEIFGLGVAWKWIEPKYKSILNTAQFFGGKDQKFYSQKNHMDGIEAMHKNCRTDLYKFIASHSCYNNSYINKEEL